MSVAKGWQEPGGCGYCFYQSGGSVVFGSGCCYYPLIVLIYMNWAFQSHNIVTNG